MSSKTMFAISTGGIYVSYLAISLCSEKLYFLAYLSYSHQYPSATDITRFDKFDEPLLIVWLGALFCSIFGFSRSYFLKEDPNPNPIGGVYSWISLFRQHSIYQFFVTLSTIPCASHWKAILSLIQI